MSVLFVISFSYAQEVVLKKGIVNHNIKVVDSLSQTFSIYIPNNFDVKKNWPVVFVFDPNGKSKQALSLFKNGAEKYNFVLIANDGYKGALSDSINVKNFNAVANKLTSLINVDRDNLFLSGFGDGARFALRLASKIEKVSGVMAIGAGVTGIYTPKVMNSFLLIGIVGDNDLNNYEVRYTQKQARKFKYPTELIIFEGKHQYPNIDIITKGFSSFYINSVNKGSQEKDSLLIAKTIASDYSYYSKLRTEGKYVFAYTELVKNQKKYRFNLGKDYYKEELKELKRSKLYKADRKAANIAINKENFLRNDYIYYLDEDLATYNFENLGWWSYQMEELKKFETSDNMHLQKMSNRLRGAVLLSIDIRVKDLKKEKQLDEEALDFILMLKTVVNPKAYQAFLQIINMSAKREDHETSIFYTEELLKNGFKDIDMLYDMEHMTFFKFTPEFNDLVKKYLGTSRY